MFMNARSTIDMLEATGLTREGRLDEAMAVLRRALAGAPPSQVAGDACPPGPTPPILDMLPPWPATGGAWTAPQPSAARARTSMNRPHIPDCGLLDRLMQGRAASGLIGPALVRAPLPVPDGARFDERSYANAAGRRAYKLYVPSGYNGQALPLVMMLHGCTQSPDDFAAGTRMNNLAEEQTFLVAYPAQAQSANASRCWNWFNTGDQQRDQGEPSLIAGITRAIMRDVAVDPARIYIAGLSAGGAAAAVMGATYPDLYTAIGVHSGLACGAASDIPSAFAAMRQGRSSSESDSRQRRSSGSAVPTIVFHGDRDPIVNPVNGDQVIAQSKAAADLRTIVTRGEAAGGMSYTRIVQADDRGRPMLEQWVLHGAGHASRQLGRRADR
jgi:poly(hydroxyalkanoate) depolymerase family esterase